MRDLRDANSRQSSRAAWATHCTAVFGQEMLQASAVRLPVQLACTKRVGSARNREQTYQSRVLMLSGIKFVARVTAPRRLHSTALGEAGPLQDVSGSCLIRSVSV